MRFFVTEEERKMSGNTSFIEFQKGEYNGTCWHIDSICMDEDIFYNLRLRSFFMANLPQFDYYGITQVSGSEFEKILEASSEFSTDVSACIAELKEWLGDTEGKEILFTICGM